MRGTRIGSAKRIMLRQISSVFKSLCVSNRKNFKSNINITKKQVIIIIINSRDINGSVFVLGSLVSDYNYRKSLLKVCNSFLKLTT